MCDKQATVHLTEIVEGEKMERHLCEECAQSEGITINVQIAPIKSMPVNELLNSLAAAQDEAQDLLELNCPQCDLTWAQFRKNGVLGCANDYVAFGDPLRRLVEQAQGGGHEHTGKTPKRLGADASTQTTLRRLRQDLQEAVTQEDYEGAARLRDEIEKLTQ